MSKKKIVICASSSFDNEINEWKEKLEAKNFEVIKYPIKINDNFLTNYKKEFTEHYDAISKANIVLALNLEKKGIPGYIGAGVFAEMAFAIGLNKTLNKKIEVCYLNPLPGEILPYSDELKLWQQLGWIKLFES
jgi:hypothetical protein